MRFERLYVQAFGPFTNLDLEFPAQGSDLHVIYGPNEAGKSSLLRAFRDLLFGIPGQSPDNFLHDYKKLRIKGEIVNRAGGRLIFQRRKGQKNTLLDADGKELPDDVLGHFLGSVDQKYFSAMFGLGTTELRDGAEELLRGKGEIGNALFSASMGGTPVQLVLAALTEESDRLFKGRATSNVSIRPTVNAYKELLNKSRNFSVKPEEWEKIEHSIAEAENEKAKLNDMILAIRQDLEWISRCEDALHTVGLLDEEKRKLEAIPPIPEVSSDFVERARIARKAASETEMEVKRLMDHINNLEEQSSDCRISPILLAEAETLDRLHQDLGVYRERKVFLTDLKTQLAGFEAILTAGMKNLGLTGSFSVIETLRLNSTVQVTCEEVAYDLQKALEKRDKNVEKIEDLKAQISIAETQLLTLPETDLTNLRGALSFAAEAINANNTLSASESEIKRLTREVENCHRGLLGAPNDLGAVENLPVPTKATIRRVGEEMKGIERDIKGAESILLEGKNRIKSLKAELVRMERRGELPSEQALRVAREHRDHGWSLVLSDWKGKTNTEEFVPGKPLEEAFPEAIIQADHIADQLREHAEAVAQAEEKRFQITQCEKQNQESEGKISDLQNKLKKCQAAWENEWLPCGFTPQTPAEMEGWRDAWKEFTVHLQQLRAAEETFQQKNNQIQKATIRLANVLSENNNKGFKLLYDEALRRVQQGEQTSGRRIEVINQLKVLKSSLGTHERNNTRFTTDAEGAATKWEAQCEIIGIPKDISPKSGLALLQERRDLLAKYDSWKEASAKSLTTNEAVRQYEKSIEEKAIALGVRRDSTEAQEADLWKALGEARVAKARHEQLAQQIKVEKNTLKEKQVAHNQALRKLEEYLHQAKLKDADELEPLLANLESRNKAREQINTLRGTLSGLARGQTVDDFLDRYGAEDMETLPQKKDELESQKREKEADLQKVDETLLDLKNQRRNLEAAGDTAADYRQQAESCAARLRQDASRFVRLRLSAYFLQTEIERFRKENQGPLLRKASQVFNQITRGAFDGLGAEFNSDDTPILVGLRPDQTSVPIAGMSDGARDQLYLALRLAALDQYLAQHEPMPLILDDLLVTCDDNRAMAILPQLADLAQRTQIFLFTHHGHLVELCRKTLNKDIYHLHMLSPDVSAENI